MTPPTSEPLVVRPRLARLVGGVWLAAAAALVLAGVVVLVDQHRVGWELPLGAAAGVLGWWSGHRRLVLDAYGIEQHVGWRRTRLLWGVVEAVEVRPAGMLAAPVHVHLAGRGPVVLEAAWGLSRAQRDELAEVVTTSSAERPGSA